MCITETPRRVPHESGRAVPEEKLQALGFKLWALTGSDDDLEEKFKKIGKEMGLFGGARQSVLGILRIEWTQRSVSLSSPGSAQRSNGHSIQGC